MNKCILKRVMNRWLHLVARFGPGATTLRPWLHRARGLKIGRNVFIGEEVYLDNEYPECIELMDHVQLSIRVIVVAHTRGPGGVVIERGAFIGPNAVIVCGAGRILRIGEGAVIGAGSVITKSVPARLFVGPSPTTPFARVTVPLPLAKTMEEFWGGLAPLPVKPAAPTGSVND